MRSLAAVVLALALATAPAQASGSEEPHITDPPGDANGTGLHEDTRPASYDPADLLAVRFETSAEAVAVGDDGLRWEPEALVVRFETLGDPEPDFGMHLAVEADTAGCRSVLRGFVAGAPPSPDEPEAGTAEWVQFGPDCPDAVWPYSDLGAGVVASHAGWTAEVDSSGEVVLRFPLDSLTEAQRAFLGLGSTLASPSAQTGGSHRAQGAWSGLPIIDVTEPGRSFTVGEDLPDDVPCTQNCPGD